MLINISFAPQELQSVQEAMESYIDGLTTAYQIDLRDKLLMALSAQASIENSVHDSEPNDGCDSNPCPYCIDEPDVPTVALGYVVERLVDAFEQDDPEAEVKRFLEELFGNVGAHKSGSQTVTVDYVLDRLNDIKGDGEFDADEFFQFIDELEKVVGVSND